MPPLAPATALAFAAAPGLMLMLSVLLDIGHASTEGSTIGTVPVAKTTPAGRPRREDARALRQPVRLCIGDDGWAGEGIFTARRGCAGSAGWEAESRRLSDARAPPDARKKVA